MDTGATNAVSALLGSVADGVTSSVVSALPIAGPVFATIAGIFIALKIFKKVTGAKA